MAYDFPNTPTIGQVFQGYTWDGEKWAVTFNAPNQSGVIAIKVFTASGTYVPSANMTTCVIECVGGGGGGAGCIATTTNPATGGGGGSGAYSSAAVTTATIGASQAVTVGAGGAGGAPGGNLGGTGGVTSVGTICVAAAGAGGAAMGAASASYVVAGGIGGAAGSGTGDVKSSGVAGAVGIISGISCGGNGGPSFFGGGATGSALATGAAGSAGGGGAGAASYGSAGPFAGGNGGSGLVIITEYGMTALSSSAIAAGAVRFDLPQGLSANQQAQARSNTGVTKKNYIINGAMMVSQENGTTGGLVNSYYPVDMFFSQVFGTSGVLGTAQVAGVTLAGSPYRLRAAVNTADAAVAAGDIVWIETSVEGLRAADLRFGSSAAKTIIIQFGVKAPAGTYCVTILNDGPSRSYVAEYVIAAGEANIDVIKSVTIPGDTTGTWKSDNTLSFRIRWGLMVGSTYQQAAGSWSTGNAVGSSNQFNFMASTSNTFELFDVSLTEGTVAPPFQVPDYASETAACKRYYAKITASGRFQTTAANLYSDSTVQWPVEMRAAPTITLGSATSASNVLGGSIGVFNVTTMNGRFEFGSAASGDVILTGQPITANARL